MNIPHQKAICQQASGSPISKLILLVLAANANEGGEAALSLTELLALTGRSRSTVIRHIAALESRGLILGGLL